MNPFIFTRTRSFYLVQATMFIFFFFIILPTGFTQRRTVAPDNNDKEKVMAASKAALEKAANGDVKESIHDLTTLLSTLPDTKQNAELIAYTHLNLGFIYHVYGSEQSDAYLSRAIHHYKESLKYQPDDVKALNNLILVYHQTGAYDSTVTLLKKIIKLDPQNEGVYFTKLGDVYSSIGESEKSWDYYQRALSSEHPDPTAGQKLLVLYNQYDNSTIEQLYKQCIDFESSHHLELARMGYENLLSRFTPELTTIDPAMKEEVMMRWIETSIQGGYVTPEINTHSSLERISYAPFQELQHIIAMWVKYEKPEIVQKDLKWWKKDELKYSNFLAFEKSYADHEMNFREPKYGILLYEDALKQIWPMTSDNNPPVYEHEDELVTDLIVTLARIYNNPKFKLEDRWKRLEDMILQEKGEAFATNNLAERQKYHTILAQIYMERGEFDGGGYRNAEFQLRNAINVTNQRVKDDPNTYHPIPTLYQLQAHLYDTLHEESNAYEAYVNAALGYLESDNLKKSGEMLKKANVRNKENQFEKSKLTAVETIYKTRVQIPQLDKSRFDENQATHYKKESTYDWLSNKSLENAIPADVLERQRFKVLSDLSKQAAESDAEDASKKLSQEARSKSNDIKVMSSRQDEIRLNEIENKEKASSDKNEKAYRFSNYNYKVSAHRI